MCYLPSPYQEAFRTGMIPHLRRIMGSTAGPWDPVSDDDIRSAWTNAFPDEESQMKDDHVAVISKLASLFFSDSIVY
jgi:hypothetical protein